MGYYIVFDIFFLNYAIKTETTKKEDGRPVNTSRQILFNFASNGFKQSEIANLFIIGRNVEIRALIAIL